MQTTSPRTALTRAFLILGMVLFASLSAQEDAENSQDHELYTRMPRFFIENYQQSFDVAEYTVHTGSEEKTLPLEGKVTRITYQILDESPAPSPHQIVTNYVRAGERLGGELVSRTRDYMVLQLFLGPREVWSIVQVYNGGETYELTVVERGDIPQEITPGSLLEELSQKGRATLYLHFETDSAELKPQNTLVLSQIVSLLKNEPRMELKIEGHTDGMGTPEHNLSLSLQRAEAVVAALEEAGIAPGRLLAAGLGSSSPIADNRTLQGRALNRRVELVRR